MNDEIDKMIEENQCLLCSDFLNCLSLKNRNFPCSRHNDKETNESKSILKSKIVIIINGKGGVGKDTLCDFAREVYSTKVISSITPIKEIASIIFKKFGYKEAKGDKERRLLSDLKDAFTKYDDIPFKYIMNELNSFYYSDDDLIFVHVREPEEIGRLKKFVEDILKLPCITLLVKRGDDEKSYGNHADDNVFNYNYDVVFYNNDTLFKAKEEFCDMLLRLFKEKEVID